MSKRAAFKSQASSSRAAAGTGFGGFGSSTTTNTLSYLAEPANLSAITDPNVVVSFKNLTKKDGTTKTKGLEDLRTYIASLSKDQGGVEDPILEAWVNLYPRLSIDNSRRVRELSHLVFCDLLKSARKRMEKHIPKLAGSWLAGVYDKDRTAAKAAQTTLSSFLNTDAKLALFKRQCQASVLRYAEDALAETPETLSDERTMSEDDRMDKYNRVVSSTLYLVGSFLSSLDKNDLLQCQEKYEALLSKNQTIWTLATSQDAYVRKSVNELLVACVINQPGIVEASLEVIHQNIIAKGLRVSQSTTASSLLSALVCLSTEFPQIWTAPYGKREPFALICSFMEKGPQSCNEQFWVSLFALLNLLPTKILVPDIKRSELILKALESGIASRDTISTHLETAWACYADIAGLLVSRLPSTVSPIKLCEATIYPLFRRWLTQPSVGPAVTAIAVQHLGKLYNMCASVDGEEANTSFTNEWKRLGDGLITEIHTSLPEQSQNYKDSQDGITAKALRWFQLAATISNLGERESTYILVPSCGILLSAISTVRAREGKPYSAAATAEAGVRLLPRLAQSSDVKPSLEDFLRNDFSRMMISPSAKYVISIFQCLGERESEGTRYRAMWDNAVHKILSINDAPTKLQGIIALISMNEDRSQDSKPSNGPTFVRFISHAARCHSSLQNFLLVQFEQILQGKPGLLPLLKQALKFNAMDSISEARMVERATGSIFTLQFLPTLEALDIIFTNKPILLQSEQIQTVMTVKLFSLTEYPEQKARETALRNIIDTLNSGPGNHSIRQKTIVAAIQYGLTLQNPLSTDTLVRQARALSSNITDPEIYEHLLPDFTIWAKELIPYLIQPPNPSLGLMRPSAGSVFLAKMSEDISKELLYLLGPLHKIPPKTDLQTQTAFRDRLHLSRPLRMAMYAVGLFSDVKILKKVSGAQQETLIRLVAITRELASDQIDLMEENKLYGTNEDAEALELVRKFVADYKLFINGIAFHTNNWRDGVEDEAEEIIAGYDMSVPIHGLVKNLIAATGYTKPRVHGYYAARVLARLMEALCSVRPWKYDGGEQWITDLGIMKTSSSDTLAAQSLLIGIDNGLLDSKVVNKFCNNLVSDLADAKPDAVYTLEKVILLNACMELYKNYLPVAKNRLVFTVKNMISWTPELATHDKALSSEVCRALQLLLPATKDIYGSHWNSTVEFCVSIWESSKGGSLSDENIPMVGMSLKLYSVLRKMKDPNDDLQEALEEHNKKIIHGLLSVLKLRRKNLTVPLRYIDELLSRLLRTLPPLPVSEVSELYPLVASDFPLIQTAAYTVLSGALSEAQQQISVDVILEKKDASFPIELLSLLLEVPSVHDFSEAIIADFPSAFRRYLFSWHLVFQSFATASQKVRNDYTEVLKSGEYIGPLLNFMADVLGHSVGNALDLGLAGIDYQMRRHYNMEQANDIESTEKSMQWLLSNIYCLALIYTPMVVKAWWTDCPSRQTKIAYDAWTEKFFTGIIVAEHLEEVQQWADEQEISDDEKELIVKTSTRSRDIFAGYEIDDMTMQVNIQLPTNYPLQPVVVSSINRVGIPENKWKSFMITTQAVISFSNGSITEGLSTLRRNIISALKGHTECAICYSVISSDKKTPDKKCSTCNNLFHSKCLYTWFMSSSQSTCPLCRNPFNYGPSGR